MTDDASQGAEAEIIDMTQAIAVIRPALRGEVPCATCGDTLAVDLDAEPVEVEQITGGFVTPAGWFIGGDLDGDGEPLVICPTCGTD